MDETQTPNPDEDQEVSLEQINKECLDSPGYVVFVGVLSRNRDEKGFNLINFRYRRYNFSFEDTKKSIEEFAKAYRKDIDAT